MPETLREIIEDAVGSMNDYRLREGWDCHDIASEIADSHTPHYTRDLMLVAADNIILAGAAPDFGPAFDGSATASNIVAANIYDAIQQSILEECEACQRDDAGWLAGGSAPGFPRKAEYYQRMLEEG